MKRGELLTRTTKANGTLHQMGLKHRTDKCDEYHVHLRESYLDIHEKYYEELRGSPINFLELGIKRGCSLRLWKEYFPEASIHGVDVNPNCQFDDDRIHTHQASQDDSEFLLNLSETVGGFDIILDDASHINSLTIKSFDILYDKCLRNDGVYIMEDLGNSYVDLSKSAGYWDGELLYNQSMGVDLSHKREDMDNLFSSLIKRLDTQDSEIRSVQFWSRIAIILKGESRPQYKIPSLW